MNVIEKLRSLLTECPLMDEFNGIHVDYTEGDYGVAGLFSNGAVKVGEDILGNQRYQMNFVLYTGMFATADYDRIRNSDLLLRLSYYLDSLKNIETVEVVDGVEFNSLITSISCSNGLLYAVPYGDINNGVQYQLQIRVNYTLYTEV